MSGGGTTYAESVCVWWGGWNGQLLVAIIIMETISNCSNYLKGIILCNLWLWCTVLHS